MGSKYSTVVLKLFLNQPANSEQILEHCMRSQKSLCSRQLQFTLISIQ